jgi:hypothetical protein
MSTYLLSANGERRIALSHRLADGIICLQTSDGSLKKTVISLVDDFPEIIHDSSSLPVSFDEMCEIVGQVEGVRFRELFERLPRVAPAGDTAMQRVIQLARETAAKMQAEKVQSEQEESPTANDAPAEGESPG